MKITDSRLWKKKYTIQAQERGKIYPRDIVDIYDVEEENTHIYIPGNRVHYGCNRVDSSLGSSMDSLNHVHIHINLYILHTYL